MNDRDLCANCDRWREAHYNARGEWLEDQPCVEYQGTNPTPERKKKKEKELSAELDPQL